MGGGVAPRARLTRRPEPGTVGPRIDPTREESMPTGSHRIPDALFPGGGPKVVMKRAVVAAYATVTTPITVEQARARVLHTLATDRTGFSSLRSYVALHVVDNLGLDEREVDPTFDRVVKASTLELLPEPNGGRTAAEFYGFQMRLHGLPAIVQASVDRTSGAVDVAIDD